MIFFINLFFLHIILRFEFYVYNLTCYFSHDASICFETMGEINQSISKFEKRGSIGTNVWTFLINRLNSRLIKSQAVVLRILCVPFKFFLA